MSVFLRCFLPLVSVTLYSFGFHPAPLVAQSNLYWIPLPLSSCNVAVLGVTGVPREPLLSLSQALSLDDPIHTHGSVAFVNSGLSASNAFSPALQVST